MRASLRKTKSAYHHGNLPKALIRAALELMAKKEDASFTLREVSHRVGVSHVAAYRHFRDKTAILAKIAEEGFYGLQRVLTAANQEANLQPLEQIRKQTQAYVKFAVEHPEHFRVMFQADLHAPGTHLDIQVAKGKALGCLRRATLAAQRQGAISEADIKPMVIGCWSAMHGLAILAMDHQLESPLVESTLSLSQVIDSVAKAVVSGYARERTQI